MGLGIKDKEIPLRANIETVRVSQIFLLSRTRRGSQPYRASYAAAYRAVLFYSLTCRDYRARALLFRFTRPSQPKPTDASPKSWRSWVPSAEPCRGA